MKTTSHAEIGRDFGLTLLSEFRGLQISINVYKIIIGCYPNYLQALAPPMRSQHTNVELNHSTTSGCFLKRPARNCHSSSRQKTVETNCPNILSVYIFT